MNSKKKSVATQGDAAYKEDLFLLWYKKGKLGVKPFYNIIPASGTEWKPTRKTLARWISSEFLERARVLDDAVHKELQTRVVHEKVEMLERHAVLGEKMQEIGAKWLKDHEGDITASVAVRLLVEGWRIERESRGIPEALEKYATMSDDELLSEIQDLINTSVTIIESE